MSATQYRRSMYRLLPALALLVATSSYSAPASAQTLESVKARGSINCGVNPALLGFSTRDDKGAWSGFDIDLCRALAAAIFNDPGKVQYMPLDTRDRLSALSLKLNFAAVTYYDGQGFLVRRSTNATSALELDGATICVQKDTTSALNVADFFRNNNMKFQVLALASANDAVRAYDDGKCTVLTSDTSQLFAERLRLKSPDEHVVLPDIISKEPLGPVVRFGDDQWLSIVKWTHYAMLNAEELGVSSVTVDEALKSTKPDVKRLVGTDENYGEHLGLTKDWAVRIIRHVGNYGEVFERNVGTGSKLSIPRGINSLWSNGGIQYAPPIR
jgi:general L-amino acid transport system substrate-binding protein